MTSRILLVSATAELPSLDVAVPIARVGPGDALAALGPDVAAVVVCVDRELDAASAAAREVRARAAGTPIVLVAERGHDLHGLLDLELVDVAARPVDPRFLSAKLRMLVRLHDERRSQTEALERERRWLHDVLEHVPAGIAVVRGPDAVYELSNRENVRLTGGRARPGASLRDAFADPEPFLALLERVRTTREPLHVDEVAVLLPGPDGREREAYVAGRYDPIVSGDGEGGEVEGILGFGYEITEQVLARRRAQASEARFRRLHDSGVIGIVFWHRDGRIVDANDAFLRMVGYEREELVRGDVRWSDMTPPEHAERDARAFAEMDREGFCTPYEKEYLCKDGSRLPIQLGAAFWEGSTSEGVAWILDDRERRSAIEAQRRSERRLRLVMDSVPALIALVGPDLRYRLVNRAYEEWFDVRREDVVDRRVEDVIGPDAMRAVQPHIDAVLSGRRVDFATRLAYRSGGARDVHATYLPKIGPDGEIDGYVAMILDVTPQRQAERDREELLVREQAARAAAEAAVRKRDEFLSIASHELKTPLTSLTLHLDLLARALARGDLARVSTKLAQARAQATRLGALVDELLDVTRIATGHLGLDRTGCDLAALVRDVASRFDEIARGEGCALEIDAEQPMHGHWDKGRLDQVVTNLISNALKYGRGAPVHVRAFREDGRACVEVRDAGIGIAPEDHERIFERFERATTAKPFTGLGVGLYVVRSIVEAHGGRARVQSRVGEGATFTIELPVE